jgi:CBS domain-containing protein
VLEAAQVLVQRGLDGAPVVDVAGRVVGMLSADDLIVQDSQLHLPTVLSILGAYIELPSSRKHFEDDLHKALGGTVSEVMATDVVTVAPRATLGDAATLMHERRLARLPVVDTGGRLVGIIARGDILRDIVAGAAGTTGAVG